MNILKLFYLIVLIITLCGCDKKDMEVHEPDIVVSDPAENEVFSVFDTIEIKAVIKHTSDLKSISISVTDEDLKPVITSKSFYVHGKEVYIDTFLIADNRYIENQLNYIHIEIEDANNLFNSWIQIYINPLDKQLENLMFVSGIETQKNLYLLKEDEEKVKLISWSSDYIGGFVDSKFKTFYTAGSFIDGLRGISIEDPSSHWSVATQPTGSIPYFNSFDAINGRVSVGLWDGSIDSYDQNGQRIFSSSKIPNGRFSHLLNLRNHIVGIFTPHNGGISELLIYNYPAGNLYHSVYLQGTPLSLIMINEMTVLLLTEVNEVIKAHHYKIEEKSLYFIHNVTTQTVTEVKGNGQNVFLKSSDDILWYRPEINSTVKYLSITDIESFVFEPEQSILYISKGNEILAYRIPSLIPHDIHSFEEPVKDILLLYNK